MLASLAGRVERIGPLRFVEQSSPKQNGSQVVEWSGVAILEMECFKTDLLYNPAPPASRSRNPPKRLILPGPAQHRSPSFSDADPTHRPCGPDHATLRQVSDRPRSCIHFPSRPSRSPLMQWRARAHCLPTPFPPEARAPQINSDMTSMAVPSIVG